ELERSMLSAPDDAISWRMQIVQGTARPAVVELAGWPQSPEADRFGKVRKQYFEAIRSPPKDLVTQGADPLALKPLVLEYAGAYLDMVQSVASRAGSAEAAESQRALVELRRILSIDSVRVAITDYRDRYREAALISPLHPLRA